MFTVKPYFSDDFVCKADKCTDTCCAGWEIDIDEVTLKKYREADGDFGKKLQDGIDCVDGVYSFRLKENERCWFLAENGLCEIYSHLGEDCLCEICKEHPRFYNCYDNAEEMGFGLCCEKVCELLFEDNQPFAISVSGQMPDDDYTELFRLRNKCFEIIGDRDNLFADNVHRLLLFSLKVQSEYFNEDFKLKGFLSKSDLFKDVLNLYSETEPINSDWSSLLAELYENIDKIVSVSEKTYYDDIHYEKIISYIVYRHLIESAFCGNFIGGISFSVAGVIFIHILDCLSVLKNGKLTTEERVNNVKLWSKQIEYSQENIDLLTVETHKLFFI